MSVAGWLTLEASDTSRELVAALAVPGILAAVIAPFWMPALAVALLLELGAYGVLLAVDEPPLDARAAVVAAGLVVVAGLADWAAEVRTTSADRPGTRWRRPAWIAVGGIVALGVAGLVLAVADAVRTDGVLVEAAGAAAALAALGLVLLLATSTTRR